MSRRTWTAVHSAINRSLKLAELNGHAARVFFHQLLQAVDSHGCIDARPHILLVEVWPLLGETIASTEAAARELERVGLVVRKRDAKAEWLEIPDWDDKAGALIRNRGKRCFGAEPVREECSTTPAPAQQDGPQVQHVRPEVQHQDGTGPAQSGTASRSNSPSRSSLAASPAVSPRVSRAHTREAPPAEDPEPPVPLSEVARVQLVRHPTLCTAEVHAALVHWEAWQRGRGKLPKWTAERWAAGLAEWATWGPDRLVRAIERSIVVGSDTVLEPRYDAAPALAARPNVDPVLRREREDRAAVERDLERLWFKHEPEVELEVTSPVTGERVTRRGPARRYPGPDVAEQELRDRGLWPPLNGVPVNGHGKSGTNGTPVNGHAAHTPQNGARA